MRTDQELMTAYCERGDQSAFTELYNRYARLVYSVVLRYLRSGAEAEDATIACFMVFMKKIHGLRNREKLSAWFFWQATGTARTVLRSNRRRELHEVEAASMTQNEAAGQWDDVISAMERELGELPARQREVLVLKYYEGMNAVEIAGLVRRPARTVSRLIRNGVDSICSRLRAAGIDIHTDQLDSRLGPGALLVPVPASVMGKLAALAGGNVVSASVVELAERMLRSMLWTKIRIAAAIAASVVIVGGAAATVAQLAAGGTNGRSAAASKAETNSPAAPAGDFKPAPVNPYAGMQEREEVFEFTQKPAVTKDGDPSAGSGQDRLVITFASKGKCDATVNVVDKDGRVIRHLASGVLGANAPYPFQQDSLSQKVVWDGLRDDFSKADTAGCKVKVGLGLKAKFVRNLLYDPYDIGMDLGKLRDSRLPDVCWLGDGENDTVVVMQSIGGEMLVCWSVRAFTKDGKYVKTLWPPPAKDIEKTGVKLTTTIWGDKTPWSGWFGPFGSDNPVLGTKSRGEKEETKVARLFEHLGVKNPRKAPRPANLPPCKARILPFMCLQTAPRPLIEQNEEWIYWYWGKERVNAKTGQEDASFKDWAGTAGRYPWGPGIWGAQEFVFARDGLLYGGCRTGGDIVIRCGRDGKLVPFKENYAEEVGSRVLATGCLGNGRGHFDGMDVTEDGKIVVAMLGEVIDEPLTQDILKKVGLPGEETKVGVREKKTKELGLKMVPQGNNGLHIGVWDRDGKALTKDAIVGVCSGHGYAMDRDGNLYVNQGGVLPVGQKHLDGVAQPGDVPRQWGGSVIKFRGQGGKYPLGAMYWLKNQAPPPPEAASLQFLGGNKGGKEGEIKVTGMLWAYGGQSNLGADQKTCDCNFSWLYLDDSSRLWLPNNAVSGVMVVDSNGNRIMRVGRYGNVDDSEADLKEDKDGLRFAYLRAATASDSWLVCTDAGNHRLVQAALSYAAEETAPVP
ncbi:MAG: hypothetical protein C0404_13375 [Verrucomicrobia bacterium]|nr:hypothetical protein [Verrucomicrobiota bacterium]